MADEQKPVRSQDPLRAYRFKVEIDAIVQAGFSEVTGVAAEVEVEDVWEGGNNYYHHKLPKAARQNNLTLKKGLTDSDELWQWYLATIKALGGEGKLQRKTLHVVLYDTDGTTEMWRWRMDGAYPVKWTGPEFKADGNAVAVETLEIAHNGVSLDSGRTT